MPYSYIRTALLCLVVPVLLRRVSAGAGFQLPAAKLPVGVPVLAKA